MTDAEIPVLEAWGISVDRHNPWLLRAIFVPIFLVEVWGISLILRRRGRSA
jgi:hypothetical protein